MKMTKSKLGVAALVSLGLLGGAAMAQSNTEGGSDDQMEVQALMSTNMTIGEAISAAEASNGGRAMSAEFDNGDDGEVAGYEVELVATDGTVSTVVVNAADGSVSAYVDDDTETDDDDEGEGEGEGEDKDNG